MATETETYKLKKPDEDDFYDIGQFNQTMDLIDESLKALAEKTVALQSNLSQLQEELTQYTDTKVSELVGSAPEKLDTLEEVADALQKNDDVVTALTEAIGTKQSKLGIGTFAKNIDILGDGGLPKSSSICWCQSTIVSGTLPYESNNAYWFLLKTDVVLDNSTIRSQRAIVWEAEKIRTLERLFTNGEWYAWKEYLRTDGNLKDTTVSFTSGDDLNPTGWTAIGKIFSGAKLKDILNGFSTGIKNLRFLWKLCGENDISGLADGTITGALSQLNTDNLYKDISGEITALYPGVRCNAYIENGMVIIRSQIPDSTEKLRIELLQVPEKYSPRVDVYGILSYYGTFSDFGKSYGVVINTSGKIEVILRSAMSYPESYTIQYPLRRD